MGWEIDENGHIIEDGKPLFTEKPSMINYDQLWDYFQEEDGIDIYASDSPLYIGSIRNQDINDKSGQKCWVCINGPEEYYPYDYCKKREDLPEIVEGFISEGGSIEDIKSELDIYANRKKKAA